MKDEASKGTMQNVASKEGTTLLITTNMCFYLFAQLSNLPVGFSWMLESFQGLFPEEIPCRLPPIKGIKHQIDFTTRVTLPNLAVYRDNPKESKEIQQ
ncbi:hypothetical protein CR513_61843, partial [Mucuna pruriens]